MTNFSFYRDLADGSAYRLGTAVQYADGWRFVSNTSHKSSRKMHATMEKCLPRWLGYPDKCRSEAVMPCTDWPNVETDTNAWRDWAKAGKQ